MESIRKNSFSKRGIILFLSFVIPVIGFVFILYFSHLWPFGDQSIVCLDLDSQYISFFSYLKEIFRDPTTLFYTFSKTLGGDMIGLVAYYLISPFNIITLFFSTGDLPIAITIIIILKIGCAGVSFNLLLRKEEYSSLIYSSCYALMAFIIAYYSNIIWLDGIILLPLIVYGIEKLVIGKSPLLYILCLSLSIFTNYYIGYMLCIFSVIYFLFCVLFKEDTRFFRSSKVFITFSIASIIAGGLSAVLLIPVKYSLETTKVLFDLSDVVWNFNFSVRDFSSKLILGSHNFQEVISGLPNIYCGYIGLISFTYYLLFSKFDKKERLGCLLIMLILILSFMLKPLNLVWHGFSEPNWFPYRYSFIFSFFILYFGYKGYRLLNNKDVSYIVIVIGFLWGLAILYGFMGSYAYLNLKKTVISIIFVGIISIFLSNKKVRRVNLLLIISVFELVVNGIYTFIEIPHMSTQEYREFISQIEPVINEIKSIDGGFYRFEKTFQRTQNDSMLFNYAGLSHNSSAEAPFVRSYLHSQLGFCTEDNWTYYNSGTTYVNDSLLGIKYVLTDQKLTKGYSKIKTYNEYILYKNDYSLPLGYLIPDDAISFIPSDFSWMKNQNEIWKVLTNKPDLEILKVLEPKIVRNNIKVENDSVYYKTGNDAYLEFSITMPESAPAFAYFTSTDESKVSLFINDQYLSDYFTYGQHQIIRLGEFAKDETFSLKIKIENDVMNINTVNIFYQDMKAYSIGYETLTKDQLRIKKLKNGYIAGEIEVDSSSFLLLQVPYDLNWHFYVDGIKTLATECIGIYTTLKMSEGFHTIQAIYIPRGLKLGGIISVISLVTLFFWIFKIKK